MFLAQQRNAITTEIASPQVPATQADLQREVMNRNLEMSRISAVVALIDGGVSEVLFNIINQKKDKEKLTLESYRNNSLRWKVRSEKGDRQIRQLLDDQNKRQQSLRTNQDFRRRSRTI